MGMLAAICCKARQTRHCWPRKRSMSMQVQSAGSSQSQTPRQPAACNMVCWGFQSSWRLHRGIPTPGSAVLHSQKAGSRSAVDAQKATTWVCWWPGGCVARELAILGQRVGYLF